MMDNSIRLYRLASNASVINLNQMFLTMIKLDPKLNGEDLGYISGVMRFSTGDDKIVFPRYKYLLLLKNYIYIFNKFHKYGKLELGSYFERMEFNSMEDAKNAWEQFINNPVIRLNINQYRV